MKNVAILVAGGSGSRMKSSVKKQYLVLDGVPVLGRCLQVFDKSPVVHEIILVVPLADIDFCRDEIVAPLTLGKSVRVVAGGIERQDSVWKGLESLPDDTDLVLIHDGVRPFVTVENISNVVTLAKDKGAAILAMAATDTLKRVGDSGMILETMPRFDIWLAQTPQVFNPGVIKKAHILARETGFKGTDDASLMENAGEPVAVSPGSPVNMKITTPADLTLASALLASGCVA